MSPVPPDGEGRPPKPKPARSPAYLRYFTAVLAMTSGSPRPPDISRCGPHQLGPARQASAWAVTRDRREPATSSPSPSSDRSDDMQLSRNAPPAAGACAALRSAPERRGRAAPPEAPAGSCVRCGARVPASGRRAPLGSGPGASRGRSPFASRFRLD